MNRCKLGIMFPIVAALTILSGAVLYWRDSDGLQLTWITSPTGLAFTIGGLAAIIAFVGGAVFIGPGIAEQTAVRGELASGDGVPSPAQREHGDRADGRLKLANRIDLPLLILAGLTMAVARYCRRHRRQASSARFGRPTSLHRTSNRRSTGTREVHAGGSRNAGYVPLAVATPSPEIRTLVRTL